MMYLVLYPWNPINSPSQLYCIPLNIDGNINLLKTPPISLDEPLARDVTYPLPFTLYRTSFFLFCFIDIISQSFLFLFSIFFYVFSFFVFRSSLFNSLQRYLRWVLCFWWDPVTQLWISVLHC